MNVLKLRAVHLALKVLLPFVCHKHVLIRLDSNSVVYHINHQGGVKSLRCLQVATDILPWAWQCLSSLRAIHIPGAAFMQQWPHSVQDGASPRGVDVTQGGGCPNLGPILDSLGRSFRVQLRKKPIARDDCLSHYKKAAWT